MITTARQVADLGTVLGIWAHPDDEAYLSGGLMSVAAREYGNRVVCVTATRGEHGTGDPEAWPAQRLAATRTEELARCLDVLGVAEHLWLDLPDGGCAATEPAGPIARLAEIIVAVRPDTVLTFGDDGYTGHADHRAVGRWAAAAFDRAAHPHARLLQAATDHERHARWDALTSELSVFEPGYPVLVPRSALAVRLELGPVALDCKVRALAAQQTQTAQLIEALGVEQYTAWVAEEIFVERARIHGGARSRSRRIDAIATMR